jgi:hypothetical protein
MQARWANCLGAGEARGQLGSERLMSHNHHSPLAITATNVLIFQVSSSIAIQAIIIFTSVLHPVHLPRSFWFQHQYTARLAPMGHTQEMPVILFPSTEMPWSTLTREKFPSVFTRGVPANRFGSSRKSHQIMGTTTHAAYCSETRPLFAQTLEMRTG